ATQSAPAPHCGTAYKVGNGITAIDTANGLGAWDYDGTVVTCNTPPPLAPSIGTFTRLNSLVVSTSGTGVFAYPFADCGNVSNGCRTTWSTDIGANPVGPAVALPGNMLAVATQTGNVVVLDGTTGAVRFTDHVGRPLSFPIAATHTTVFAAATDGTLAAFPVA